MPNYNIVILGAGGVGKSALTVRYIRSIFLEDYNPTIEEEYRRNVTLDGETSSLEIMDTAGAEQFMSLNEVYIKAGHGFILVFSLTQAASLKDLENLREQIFRIKGTEKSIPIVVVGTKLDLTNEREVQRETIQPLAARWGLPFYETSAKRDWHVNDVFEDLLRQMRAQNPKGSPRKGRGRGRGGGCIVM